MSTRPNVLFLNTDQQSRLAQGWVTPWIQTPNLDALSASGVRFTRGYCAAPVCGPSRSCLHFAQPSHRTGVMANHLKPNPDLPELSDLFRQAGYDVGWHGMRGGDQGRSDDPDGALPVQIPDGPRLGINNDGPVVDAAIQFLQRPRDQPFFLSLSLTNPHDICYWVMDRAQDTADPAADLPPLPDNVDPLSPDPEFIERCRRRTHYGQENSFTTGWDDDRWRRYLREYAALTERVDGEVGRLLAALRDAGLEQDTIILHTADHGEGMAHHRWVVKLMLWESVVGVPLSISWPGRIEGGQERATLSTGMDVMPTLCDLAGIPSPPGLCGRSLAPVIEEGDADDPDDHVVIELHPDNEDLDFAARIVVSRRHKYVALSHGEPQELLFDLSSDPGETLNRVADNPAEVARHRAYLADWIQRTDDPFVAQPAS